MTYSEGSFRGEGGLKLFYRSSLPEKSPAAIVLLVHGLAEHSGRYSDLARTLVAQGYGVYGFDLRGHGESEGKRCHLESFDHLVRDLELYFNLVRAWHPDCKLFIMGHSNGGTIVTAFATRHPYEADGLIVSSIFLVPGASVSTLKRRLGPLIARLFPNMGVERIRSATISRDPERVKAYDNDPLVYRGRINAHTGVELLSAMQKLPPQLSKISLPILILHGTGDRLAHPDGARLLHKSVRSHDKTLVMYDGCYHELLGEPERGQVLADILGWLKKRT